MVYKIIDPHNYLLMTLDGKLLPGLFEHERINPYHTEGYSQLVSTSAKCDYSHDHSKCSSMPSGTIVLY